MSVLFKAKKKVSTANKECGLLFLMVRMFSFEVCCWAIVEELCLYEHVVLEESLIWSPNWTGFLEKPLTSKKGKKPILWKKLFTFCVCCECSLFTYLGVTMEQKQDWSSFENTAPSFYQFLSTHISQRCFFFLCTQKAWVHILSQDIPGIPFFGGGQKHCISTYKREKMKRTFSEEK